MSQGHAAKIAIGVAGGMGCLASPLVFVVLAAVVAVFGGLGVLLAPILIFFNTGNNSGGGSAPDNSDEIAAVIQGDGKGKLDEERVPEKLLGSIKDAGDVCDAIGPVVIAAQIERESNYKEDYVGPDGAEGISQLPKDVFKRLGEDEDSNGKTSAFDAADSILAQGRYMCELADQAQDLIDQEKASGSLLDLALAAYHAGPEKVREAQGVPQAGSTLSYVAGVRALFARYQGVIGDIAPPDGSSPPANDDSPSKPPASTSPTPGDSTTPTPSDSPAP